MSKKSTIGIIGGGMIAQVCHLPFLLEDVNCTVKTIAESRPSLVHYLKTQFGFENVVPHHDAILNDPEIDAVVIVAPRAAVGPLTLAALQAGKHVFTEKPMAHTVDQAQKLVNAAAKKNLVYGVAFMKRHDPGIQAAKKTFEDIQKTGRLGKLLFARFYDHAKSNVFEPPKHQRPQESRSERFEVWPLAPEWVPEARRDLYAWFMNVASHDVNLMHYFLGDKVDVMATSLADSAVTVSLRQNETLIALEASKTETGKWLQGTEFFFERGHLSIEIPSPMDVDGVSKATLLENDGTFRQSALQTETGWSFARQAHDTVAAFQGRQSPATSGQDALHDIALIEKIWKKGLEEK